MSRKWQRKRRSQYRACRSRTARIRRSVLVWTNRHLAIVVWVGSPAGAYEKHRIIRSLYIRSSWVLINIIFSASCSFKLLRIFRGKRVWNIRSMKLLEITPVARTESSDGAHWCGNRHQKHEDTELTALRTASIPHAASAAGSNRRNKGPTGSVVTTCRTAICELC